MVEFALILFPLLIIVVGIIQFGIGLNYWLDMNRIANQGARWAVVNAWPGCPRTQSGVCSGTTLGAGNSLATYLKTEAVSQGLQRLGRRNGVLPGRRRYEYRSRIGGQSCEGATRRPLQLPSDHEAPDHQSPCPHDDADREHHAESSRRVAIMLSTPAPLRERERESGQIVVLFALMLPMFLALSGFVIGIGNWYVHAKHLQTKADSGAFAGGGAWSFPCSASADALIETQARLYAGSNNPQVGGVPNASIHTVLNGSNWYDDDSNLNPIQFNSPSGSVCNAKTLDVKVTEDNSFPLASLIPLFPDIKRKARVRNRGR